MNRAVRRLTLILTIAISTLTAQAGSLEPPPGPVSPTRPPDTCYDNTGNRFVDCGDGTIKDTKTGLYWLKNADCFGTRDWAAANKVVAELAHGQCGLTDGSLPGDWRLPTLHCPSGGGCSLAVATGEFAAIFAPSCPAPFILDTEGTSGCWNEGSPFSGVRSAAYCSATSDTDDPRDALFANLAGGSVTTADKESSDFVWPVRGKP